MQFDLASLKLTANAPENGPSQKEINIPTIHFQVRAVSFREGIYFFCELGGKKLPTRQLNLPIHHPIIPLEKVLLPAK